MPPLRAGGPAHIPVEALPSSSTRGHSVGFGPELSLIGRSSAARLEERWNVGVYRYRWGLAGSLMAARGVASAAQPWGVIYLSRSWTDEVVFAVEVHSSRMVEVPGEVLPLAPQAAALMEVRVSNVYCSRHMFDGLELDYAPWSNHFRLQVADWVVKRIVFDDVVPVPLPAAVRAGGEDATADELSAVESWVMSLAGCQGEFATGEDTLGETPLFKSFEDRGRSGVDLAWPVWSLIDGQPQTVSRRA
uniref:RES domain-containing protein n=1 Tax=Bicosoecida sp. CB-2014 TaxID=1486930 RepID=A0A7S1G915_9STRA